MLLSRFKSKFAPVALALLTAPVFVGCNGFMHDDLPDCNRELRVRLSYTRNMSDEERVSNVSSAIVYAFDKDGKLAGEAHATASELAAENWIVKVPVNGSGDFHIVTWCGLDSESPFTLDGTRAVSTLEDITCRLGYATDADGNKTSRQAFPDLYHGTCNTTFHISDVEQEIAVSKLTKNTNMLSVTVHNQGSKVLDPNEFTFIVTDDNAVMGHDNSIMAEGKEVVYHPISVEGGKRPVADGQGGISDQEAESVVAQIPLARLMADSQGRLIVYKGTEEIFNESITELFKRSKEHEAPRMDHQEYLDRQDTYSLSFFINDDGYVIKTRIFVNEWIIVTQDIDF